MVVAANKKIPRKLHCRVQGDSVAARLSTQRTFSRCMLTAQQLSYCYLAFHFLCNLLRSHLFLPAPCFDNSLLLPSKFFFLILLPSFNIPYDKQIPLLDGNRDVRYSKEGFQHQSHALSCAMEFKIFSLLCRKS